MVAASVGLETADGCQLQLADVQSDGEKGEGQQYRDLHLFWQAAILSDWLQNERKFGFWARMSAPCNSMPCSRMPMHYSLLSVLANFRSGPDDQGNTLCHDTTPLNREASNYYRLPAAIYSSAGDVTTAVRHMLCLTTAYESSLQQSQGNLTADGNKAGVRLSRRYHLPMTILTQQISAYSRLVVRRTSGCPF